MARFWNIQDRLLYIKENFADGWFERRHVGSHAALEAAQRMCSARTGVDLAREYQEGVSGAFQRVMADGFACALRYQTASRSCVVCLIFALSLHLWRRHKTSDRELCDGRPAVALSRRKQGFESPRERHYIQ